MWHLAPDLEPKVISVRRTRRFLAMFGNNPSSSAIPAQGFALWTLDEETPGSIPGCACETVFVIKITLPTSQYGALLCYFVVEICKAVVPIDLPRCLEKVTKRLKK